MKYLLLIVLVVGCADERMVLEDGGPDTTNTEDTTRPLNGPVDPACVDGMFAEALPNKNDISAVSYSSNEQYAYDVLNIRYPIGEYIVREARKVDMATFGLNCVDAFSGGASADNVIDRMSVIVHECGHVLDIGRAQGSRDAHFILNEEVSFMCPDGDTTSRGGMTYARSRLNQDDYSALRPPCNGSRDPSCDSYADVYLDGDPDDANFEGGDQGFNSVLEETTQYVNSLAIGLSFAEPPGSVSERDGILTFLWYVERYLRQARLSFPQAYAVIAGDCYRKAILSVWGRAWLYLDATEGMTHTGINDVAIKALVMDPELLSEIQRLRDAEGC